MNLNGIRDLLGSERGAFAIAMAIASSVFVYFDKMTIESWTSFNESLGMMLIGSKTVTTAAEILKGRVMKPDPAPAPGTATATATVSAPPSA